MKSIARATVLAIVVTLPIALVTSATAQQSSEFANSKVKIIEKDQGDGGYWNWTSYANPPKPLPPERQAVRDRLMARKVLSNYAEFLSPLRLPHTLGVFASDCQGNQWDSPHYNPYWHAMNVCYSFIRDMEERAAYLAKQLAQTPKAVQITADEFIAGMFAALMLHESGHALFHILDVPVFGREEDAADAMAAFIALEFDRSSARAIVKGFSYFWDIDAIVLKRDPGGTVIVPSDPKYPKDPDAQCFVDAFCAFSDEHGTASQRMFNVLCLAYGGKPDWFKDIVDNGWLPPQRAKGCGEEYQIVRFAFRKTIYPFVDLAQMQKVKSRQWFQTTELSGK